MWIPELESDEGSTATNKAKEAFLFLSLLTLPLLRRRTRRRRRLSLLQRKVTPPPTKAVWWGFEPATTCKEVTRDSQ